MNAVGYRPHSPLPLNREFSEVVQVASTIVSRLLFSLPPKSCLFLFVSLALSQAENGGCGSLPVIVGRALPRAIASAKMAGRAPSFKEPTAKRAGETRVGNEALTDDVAGTRGPSSQGTGKWKRGPGPEAQGYATCGVDFNDLIEGHPGRAVEELEMRSRLEVIRAEVEEAIKAHETVARGYRTSWLKKIDHQNKENSYQVIFTLLLDKPVAIGDFVDERSRRSTIDSETRMCGISNICAEKPTETFHSL